MTDDKTFGFLVGTWLVIGPVVVIWALNALGVAIPLTIKTW